VALAVGVMVGTLAANLMSDRSLTTSILKGFCNAGEAVLVAWLLDRWFGRPFTFSDLSRVAGFLAVAGLATATSAIGGAATMALLHNAAPFWEVWRAWFLSDGVGVVVVTPLIIALAQLWREPPSRREWIEGTGALSLLTLARLYTLDYPSDSWLSFNPAIVVLPPLMWLLARCPPAFAMAGVSVASILIICATTFGIGRYGDVAIPMIERARGAQSIVATGTIFILVLVALIAERRRSEAQLKQSNNRLQLALDCAELGTWSLHLKTGRFENDVRDRHIHGHGQELQPKTLGEMRSQVHPDDLPKLDAAFQELRHTGGSCRTEYRLAPYTDEKRASRERWVTLEGAFVRGDEDRPEQLLGVTRDITLHKRAERALADRNLQLALAGTYALVGTYAYDVGSETYQISPGYAAVHGLPEGTEETSRGEWRTRVHPDDLPGVEAGFHKAMAERRREYHCEYRFIRPDGEIRWIDSRNFISYDSNGSAPHLVGANIDVTQRKITEAALKEHKAGLADALVTGKVMDFEWNALTGQSRRSDNASFILGDDQVGTEFGHSQFLSRVHPEDRQALASGSPSPSGSSRCMVAESGWTRRRAKVRRFR